MHVLLLNVWACIHIPPNPIIKLMQDIVKAFIGYVDKVFIPLVISNIPISTPRNKEASICNSKLSMYAK